MSDAWTLSTAELAGLGLDDKAIRQLVSQGLLIRMRRGYYRRPIPSDDLAWQTWPLGEPEFRHRFLVEATRRTIAAGTVFSHVSAAVLHGLPVPLRMLDRTWVTRNGSGSGSVSGRTHRRYAPLPREHITEIDGLPVTSLARTAADLTRDLPFAEAVAVGDAALAQGLERGELIEALGRRRPNNAKARSVIEFANPLAESAGESRCRATMKLAGLPIPTLQFVVRDKHGAEVARSDFAWEGLGVVGEFDGRVKYGRLLKPGQHVSEVVQQEKLREERIRRCDWWIGRFIEAELRNINEFRDGVLNVLSCGHPR